MYNQYLVNEPLLSMTAAHLRLQERIGSWQSSILILDHSSWSFTHKSSVLVGFLSTTFTPKVFQRFSIGLKSGLCGGQSIISKILLAKVTHYHRCLVTWGIILHKGRPIETWILYDWHNMILNNLCVYTSL